MNLIEQRLQELGIEAPALPEPAGNYVHAVISGSWLQRGQAVMMSVAELKA